MDDSILQNALRLRRAGKFAEAAALYGEILRRDPKHFEALHALGITRYQCGQLEEAERLIGEAIAVKPGDADALYNRASLLQRLNRLDEALAFFDRAIAAKPDSIQALTNRAIVLTGLGRFQAGLADFDKVLGLKPGFAQAWRNRGMALEALNRPDEALASFIRACELDPADAAAHLKRANLLLHFNRAGEAELAYEKYLAIVPGDPEAWNRRGIAAARLKRTENALECFDKAVALDPANADFKNNRANALFEMKRYFEAAEDYEKALKIAPDLPYTEGYLILSRLRCCDWRALLENRRTLAEGLAAGRRLVDPLGNLALSRSPAEQLQCARLWIADGFAQVHPPLWRGEIYRHDKIRVAYLSADFRLHPVAFLIAGVFEHHDRDRFETIGVSFAPPGESAMRTRIEKACDRFQDVREMTNDDVAFLLRRMEADIVVDLMGFTDGARTGILAFRPAPVAVNYLGYPGTMGAEYIDYILADRSVIPQADKPYYSEEVVYLPDTYLPNDSKRAISERMMSRAEAGLPETGFVFSSFNESHKIAPDVFDVWMRLLQAVEGSVLWLPQGNRAAAANLRREAEARGVLAERLVFAPYLPAAEDHLARLRLADLFLDTLPYNAHASCCDALWAGLPVVTCTGDTFAGRVAASALHAVGLPELVTESLADYEALALRHAREPSALAALKAKLAKNRDTHPLFDTARFTRHLEAAYTAMWQRVQRGEAPASFAVEP